jgi:hypothetical protein
MDLNVNENDCQSGLLGLFARNLFGRRTAFSAPDNELTGIYSFFAV